MKAKHAFYCILGIFLSLFITLLILSFKKTGDGGFTIDLIHRDSPQSPVYNLSETSYQRLNNSIRRSFIRFNSSSLASPNISQSYVIGFTGEYLMNVSIGTPSIQILGIADPCSDLIWTHCKPCNSCYNRITPIFNPVNSSSYRNLSCKSSLCNYVESSCIDNNCEYGYRYNGESSMEGNLGSDKFTLGSTTSRPVALKNNIAFGCAYKINGPVDEYGSGLIGLGGGPLSLISQLGYGQFSYCLVPLGSNSTSKFNFGSNAVVSGEGMVSTRIFSSSPETFYTLSLQGFSVGNNRLESSTGKGYASSSEPNMIIDFGTTLTFVPSMFYEELETAVKKAIDFEPVSDPQDLLKLCYRTKTDIEIPVITLHFYWDADVKLQPMNTFIRLQEDLICFAMVPTSDTGIFGNLAQMNFLVGYNFYSKVWKNSVSFMPTDCTEH